MRNQAQNSANTAKYIHSPCGKDFTEKDIADIKAIQEY